MYNFYFDTSVTSRIIYYRYDNVDTKKLRQRSWDLFITQVEKYIPGMDGMLIKNFISNSGYLEVIGLGRVQKPKSKKNQKLGIIRKRTVQYLYEEVDPHEWKLFINMENGVEEFYQLVAQRIRLFIERELSSRKLYRYALDFFRTYEAHPNAHFDLAMYKRKMKRLKREKAEYDLFCETIFWEIIFRYPFVDIGGIGESEKDDASKLWGGMMGHLFKTYYALYNLGYELSALGICSEIHRLGSLIVPQKQNDFSTSFTLHQWKDLGDALSIHLAVIGQRTPQGLLSMNVATCDNRLSVEQRIKCLYLNLKDLEEKGFQIDSKPGFIFIFDPQTMVLNGEPIDVANFLKGIDDTN